MVRMSGERVFNNEGRWYYWEDTSFFEGPYRTEEEALIAYDNYREEQDRLVREGPGEQTPGGYQYTLPGVLP